MSGQITKNKTVLVVDDDACVRKLICLSLRAEGYRVLDAGDGAGALRICEKNGEIDLLVTDVVMPGIDGSELAKALRRMRPEVKVLFISGYAQGAESGVECSAFMPKPFLPQTLCQKITEMLSGGVEFPSRIPSKPQSVKRRGARG